MSEYCLLYVTTKTEGEADDIARALLEERLVACVNLLPAIKSHFRWEGEVHCEQEHAMMLKTRSSLADEVTERIKQLHSYDCPCIVVLPIQGGNAAFLNWIGEETA